MWRWELPLPESISGAAVDQAAGLRRLFGAQTGQVVAFVSGREACGRTTVLVRTAAALAQAGQGVVLIDENSGPHNALSTLCIKARHDLLDLVQGDYSLERVMQSATPLLNVIAAAKFSTALDPIDALAAGRLNAVLKRLQDGSAFVLVDCAARNGQHLSPLALAVPHMVVVVAAQSSAITQAYALIKRLAQERGREGFHVAITRARTEQEAQAIFHNMCHTAREHLGVHLDYLGGVRVPATEHLADALQSRLLLAAGRQDRHDFVPSARSAASVTAGGRRAPRLLESVV